MAARSHPAPARPSAPEGRLPVVQDDTGPTDPSAGLPRAITHSCAPARTSPRRTRTPRGRVLHLLRGVSVH